MSEKEKLPFWLGVVLGLILGMSAVLVVVVPQLDRTDPDAVAQYKPEVKLHGLNQTAMNQVDPGQTDLNQTGLNQAKQKQPALPEAALNQVKPLPADQIDDILVNKGSMPSVPVDKAIQAMEADDSSKLAAVQQDVDSSMAQEDIQGDIQPESSVIQEKRYGIALVIDDAGYDLRAVERVLSLSVPVAISILPESPFARQSATLAKEAGQVVMLHLPMQPEDPSLQMTEGFLHSKMEEQTLRATFLKDLEKVPFVEGVNNHMGSRLTQMNKPMHWVMQVCQEKGLFFVDSRTSALSVAASSAQSMGVAWASRSIFLDHEMTLDAMKQAWQRARNCAKKKLSCVVIAHPRAKTVAFLENYLSKEDAKQMVSIRHLLQTTPLITQASKVQLP